MRFQAKIHLLNLQKRLRKAEMSSNVQEILRKKQNKCEKKSLKTLIVERPKERKDV